MSNIELISEHTEPNGTKVRVERNKLTGQQFISTEPLKINFYLITGLGENVYMCNKCNVRIERPSDNTWKCNNDCKELGLSDDQ